MNLTTFGCFTDINFIGCSVQCLCRSIAEISWKRGTRKCQELNNNKKKKLTFIHRSGSKGPTKVGRWFSYPSVMPTRKRTTIIHASCSFYLARSKGGENRQKRLAWLIFREDCVTYLLVKVASSMCLKFELDCKLWNFENINCFLMYSYFKQVEECTLSYRNNDRSKYGEGLCDWQV